MRYLSIALLFSAATITAAMSVYTPDERRALGSARDDLVVATKEWDTFDSTLRTAREVVDKLLGKGDARGVMALLVGKDRQGTTLAPKDAPASIPELLKTTPGKGEMRVKLPALNANIRALQAQLQKLQKLPDATTFVAAMKKLGGTTGLPTDLTRATKGSEAAAFATCNTAIEAIKAVKVEVFSTFGGKPAGTGKQSGDGKGAHHPHRKKGPRCWKGICHPGCKKETCPTEFTDFRGKLRAKRIEELKKLQTQLGASGAEGLYKDLVVFSNALDAIEAMNPGTVFNRLRALEEAETRPLRELVVALKDMVEKPAEAGAAE
ncbi:MAG: hypothetical protein M1549_01620 [Candidatus Dependentiae bacterium]|nr:hypothetical protein [Candidatus Dependentiae bacterium]